MLLVTTGEPSPLKQASKQQTKPKPDATTVGSLISQGRQQLLDGRVDASPREAVLLLAAVVGLNEAALRSNLDAVLDANSAHLYRQYVARRADGEPFSYITGCREFFGRSFEVDPGVLIPRPETEHLVECIVAFDLPSKTATPAILDLGTGSGCLAATLAKEIPNSTVTAADNSLAALAVAHRNACRLGVRHRVRLVASDWAEALALAQFDVVVANPPYLSVREWQQCSIDIRDHEPQLALVADEAGLAALSQISSSFVRLFPGCRVVLEIGSTQATAVSRLCSRYLEDVAIHHDLSGLERVVVGTRSRWDEG